MKCAFIHKTEAPRLIIIYAGWAMDASPFANLRRRGYDIAVIWDYRSLEFDFSVFDDYEEIAILAWSLGVWAAAKTAGRLEPRLTRCIVVSGALTPVSDEEGIPRALAQATYDTLTDASLMKFYRRMAGSKERFDKFMHCRPSRELADIKEELEVLLSADATACAHFYDIAVIGAKDPIFPRDNLVRAWCEIQQEETADAHLPDFQALLDRFFIDKESVGEHFGSHCDTYTENATVQLVVSDKMAELMAGIDKACNILEIGCGTGLLTRHLLEKSPVDAEICLWDICGENPASADSRTHFVRTDAEMAVRELPDSCMDFIASASTIQWMNSPKRFLRHCMRVLRPGGTLLFSSFTDRNLYELLLPAEHALPLPSASEWKLIIPQGFVISSECEMSVTLRFDSISDIFRHLKATGVNSVNSNKHGTISYLRSKLREAPGKDGEYRLTYTPIIYLLHKP